DNINDSSIRFIKRRNDVLDRTYAAFLLLRDNEGNVLPTNTADRVKFNKSYFDGITEYGNETDGYVIPENSIFIYNYKYNKYKFIHNKLDNIYVKNNYLNDRNKLLYINPYLLKIDKNPFIISNYFKVDIDKEFSLSYNFINDLMPFNITFNTINIKKVTNYPESMESDTFRITLELDINESMDDLLDNIKLRGVLVSSESNEKHGYFELYRKESDDVDVSNTFNIYEGLISTNRKFRENKLSLSDSLYNSDGEVIKDSFIGENL